MAMTFGDQAKRLVAEIATITPDEARRRINRSYRENSQRHAWQHLLKRFTLQTEASYNTGTVSTTESSAAVTGDGTTWVSSWVTAPSMRRMTISGRPEPYDVSAIGGATSITLADAWIGETDSALAYKLFRDLYPLPTDCGMTKVMALFDPDQRRRLRFFNQPKFLALRSQDAGLTSIPECFTVVHMTSESTPRPQIQMYPAPDSVRAFHGWYFKRPAFATTDAAYLEWPEEFDDMIWILAAIEYFEQPLRLSPKMLAVLRPKYANLFQRMKTEFDGQSAIDLEIEQNFGTRGGGWNPDPLSLSGYETVNWE